MGFLRNLGLQGLPPRAAPPLRDIQPRLSQWNPPFPNMGFYSRPGEDPNAWKHFGPKPPRPDTQGPHQDVLAARDSGTGITGGEVRGGRHLAHAGWPHKGLDLGESGCITTVLHPHVRV